MIITPETIRDIPGWMLRRGREHWAALMRATLGVIDRAGELVDELRAASMPGQINAPNYGGFESIDALPFIARDRNVVLGKREAPHAAAERLRYWRQNAKAAGTPEGLLRALRGVLYPKPVRVRLVWNPGAWGPEFNATTWWSLDDTGTEMLRVQRDPVSGDTVTLDHAFWPSDGGEPTLTSSEPGGQLWNWDFGVGEPTPDPFRAWIIIYAPCGGVDLSGYDQTWGAAGVWGDKEPGTGDPYTTGTTATNTYVESARETCASAMPVGIKVEHIIVTFTNDLFDPTSGALDWPDGTWGNAGKVVPDGAGGYVRVRARSTRARYWAGTV